MRQELLDQKPNILEILSKREATLDLSLLDFAKGESVVELHVPGFSKTLWWVPTSRHIEALVRRGVERGRIWTARELRELHRVRGLDRVQARSLAHLKAELGCELRAVDAIPRHTSNVAHWVELGDDA